MDVGTILYMVGENCKKDGLPMEIFEERYVADYNWKSDSKLGFKTVTVADYPNRHYPTPHYWHGKDLGIKIFETLEEAQACLERVKKWHGDTK